MDNNKTATNLVYEFINNLKFETEQKEKKIQKAITKLNSYDSQDVAKLNELLMRKRELNFATTKLYEFIGCYGKELDNFKKE